MTNGLFVTATGTDVGKTLVTAGLLRVLQSRGVEAAMMKPVQTGATRRADGPLRAPDIEFVREVAGVPLPETSPQLQTPYLYEPACSPHLAAAMAGETIEIPRIVEAAKTLASRHPMVIVEGAGGVMVPLNRQQTMLDLMQALGFPVVLVGHAGLGTLNHLLLSLEAMRHRGLRVAGVILNQMQPAAPEQAFIRQDNIQAVQWYGNVRVLATIPYLGSPLDLSRLDESLASIPELP